jgi:voltage-gated sodium channel
MAAGGAVGGTGDNKQASDSDDNSSDVKVQDIHTDPEQHSGFWRAYLIQANKIRDLVEGDNFNNFVLGVIVLAGFLVGIQTDPRLDPDIKLVCEDEGVDSDRVTCKSERYVGPSDFFAMLDFVILGIFGLECILKGVAEGLRPMRFFTNKEWRWNNFDFWVVVVCLPWGDIIGGDTNTGSLRILRLARLMRLMKLIKKVPQLRMIVMGLLGGLKSIGYILMLLMLLFYIFAILGMQLFRDNDPYHFGDLHSSLFTLFRASTLEDWTEIMYTNYFGCDIYPYTDYKGNHESVNNVIHPKNLYCHAYDSEKTAAPVFAAIYFPVFVLSCGLVTLSLFVATVTMSMTESMESMKEEQEEADRQRRLAKAMKGNNMRQGSQKDIGDESVSNAGLSSAQARDRDKMQAVLMNAWDGVDLTDMLSKQTESKYQGHPFKMMYMKLAIKATFVAEHPYFTQLVIAAIMVASVLVGVETETGPNDVLFVIDLIIFIIFVLEFLGA